MNPNTTSDVIDEDAAVLQFPKGWYRHAHKEQNYCVRKECCICTVELEEPYIRCAECVDVEICPSCFAQGAQTSTHRNNHDYIVLQDEFPLFEQHWSARDEERLLNAILDCGYGNWEDVSRCLVTHTPKECEKHYVNTYIEHRPTPELPRFKESLLSYYKEPVYAFQTSNVEDPPRHAPGTLLHRTLAGYNAARGDFDIEHDDAELMLSDLDTNVCPASDPDFELLSSLQLAIVGGYNERLAERKRRHKVIRNHGLIAVNKTLSWLNSFESTLTVATAEKISFLMQVLSGQELDSLYEGLSAASSAQKVIDSLMELRANGLTRIDSGILFLELKTTREEYDKTRKGPVFPPATDWQSNISNIPAGSSRRTAGPLEIFGLPGYDRLSSAEQELCKMVRIVPVSYLEFKHLLQSECKKHGFLKLAQARGLIKIDVNKTRKLYDFLVQEGFINSTSLPTDKETVKEKQD